MGAFYDFSRPEALDRYQADSLRGGVVVLGSMHGDEPLGTAVVDALLENDSPFYPIHANPAAAREGKRFIHCELSTASKHPESRHFEERELPVLIRKCNAFPVTIDIHNSINSEYAFTGPNPEPGLLKVAAFLGYSRILLTDYTFNLGVPRALGVEYIRPTDPVELDAWLEQKVPEVCEQLGKLAMYDTFSELPEVDWDSFEFYKEWRIFDNEEAATLRMSDYSVEPFQVIPQDLARALGRSPNQPLLRALFWNGHAHGDYFAGLAEDCGPPPKVQQLVETL